MVRSISFSCSLSLSYLDKGKERKVSPGQKEVKSPARSQPNPQKIYSIQSFFIIILLPTMK